MVSLAKRGLDDTSLSGLLNSIPSHSIILMEDIDAAFTRSLTREASPDNGPNQSSPSAVTLSGLLNAIDGVQAQQGRLLFATTNKYNALDPALMRPGRLDVHIEFKLASKWQAGELFKRFYPIDDTIPLPSPPAPTSSDKNEEDVAEKDLGEVSEKSSVVSAGSSDTKVEQPETTTLAEGTSIFQAVSARRLKAPPLTPEQLNSLAQRFADSIPAEEISMAALQGHLMMHKTNPEKAVKMAPAFVTKEREARAKARLVAEEKAQMGPVVPAIPVGPVNSTGPVALPVSSIPISPITPFIEGHFNAPVPDV